MSVQTKFARAPLPFTLPLVAALHAQSVTATGTLKVYGGSTVSLSGTYASGSNSVSLSGGGYSISGTLTGATVTGTLTAPTGAEGAFGTSSTTTGPVTPYCSDQVTPTGEKAVWHIVVADLGTIRDITGSFAISPNKGAGIVTGYLQSKTFQTTWYTTAGPFKGDFGTSTGTMENGVANGLDKGGNPFTASTARCSTLNAGG